MTDIPMFPVAQIDGELFVALPVTLVRELIDFVSAERAKNMRPDHPELLQARADENAAHAAERFPNIRQHYSIDHAAYIWVDEDGDRVVFTPHGYRKEREIHDELRR